MNHSISKMSWERSKGLSQSLAPNVEEFGLYPVGNGSFNQKCGMIRFASLQSHPSSIKENVSIVNLWRQNASE